MGVGQSKYGGKGGGEGEITFISGVCVIPAQSLTVDRDLKINSFLGCVLNSITLT